MELFLTLGRVASFAGKPEPGGYKIYLTDGRNQWVELGGGGEAVSKGPFVSKVKATVPKCQ